jgi:HSP20 family protein
MEPAMTDLVPRARGRAPDLWSSGNPFLALQREMGRLFEEPFRPFGAASPFGDVAWPSVEVSEQDKSVTVKADLPGLEDKDIELRVHNNVLTLKGEKRTEIEDKEKQYSERFYGHFERRLRLPCEVDEERAEATFKNGVLTVTLPKTDRAVETTKRIPIKAS